MKKYLTCALAFLSVSTLFAGSEDTTCSLDAKVVINDTCGYFVLSDGTVWKVFNFNPRWRSISEWWNDTKLMPETYKSQPKDWFEGSSIEIVEKKDAICAEESDSLNSKMLGRCSHMFYNINSDKFLFATPLKSSHVILELYNDAFKSGYQIGFEKGQRDSSIDASQQYEKGYSSGYHQAVKDLRSNNPNANNCIPAQ